ncbi:MAG: DUF3289 family protein [Apibacter sp.]|nr:DUF3289 family protein [Apibacter sp.]
MEGGNIIRKIGGKSIKRADYICFEATEGNLTFSSPKRVNMIGEQGGVEYLNDYVPPAPLRVVKLDGPFDKKGQKVSFIKKGISYQYKIIKFNRPPKEYELLRIRWATQFDDGEIVSKYAMFNGKQEARFWVPQNFEDSKVRIYAYIESPAKEVSIESRLEGKFYYKGTKQWGQLQSGFATEYSKITEEQIKKHATRLGWVNINGVRNKSLKSIKESYEGLLLGSRRVLSKEIADKVINNFYNGKGKKLSFDENTKISKDLKEYGPFRDYFDKYLKVIKYLIKERTIQTKNERDIVEIFRKNETNSLPSFNQPWHIIDYDYYGLMGGTQTIKVELEITEMENNKYELKTKMYIGDWYGADWDDVNEVVKGSVHSLTAFFWLQHHYGCQPFETEIIYQSLDYIII